MGGGVVQDGKKNLLLLLSIKSKNKLNLHFDCFAFVFASMLFCFNSLGDAYIVQFEWPVHDTAADVGRSLPFNVAEFVIGAAHESGLYSFFRLFGIVL